MADYQGFKKGQIIRVFGKEAQVTKKYSKKSRPSEVSIQWSAGAQRTTVQFEDITEVTPYVGYLGR